MVSNYNRTLELAEAAHNSAGASTQQFNKTLESLDSKLNKLRNAWDQFTMDLMNNQLIKFGVDSLTSGFTALNKFIDLIGKLSPKPFEGITKSVVTLATTLGLLQLGAKASRGLTFGVVNWYDRSSNKGFIEGLKEGWTTQKGRPKGTDSLLKKEDVSSTGIETGRRYGTKFKQGFKTAKVSEAIKQELQGINKQIATSHSETYTNWLQGNYQKLIQSQVAVPDMQKDTQDWANYYIEQAKLGKIDPIHIPVLMEGMGLDLSTEALDQVGLSLESLELAPFTNGFTKLGDSISSAGDLLVGFGSSLDNEFGAIVVRVGSLLQRFGPQITKFGKTVAENMQMLGATSILSAKGLKATGMALLSTLKIAGIIGGVAAAIYLLYRGLTENKRALDTARNAASAASEAYDSLKQEAQELKSAIEEIKETDSAFDGLVIGTSEFNEKLITANEQVSKLLSKYPQLNEFLTVDKNGRMIISEEGFKFIQKLQKQHQANAAALSSIQETDYTNLGKELKSKRLKNRPTSGSRMLEGFAPQSDLDEANLIDERVKADKALSRQNAIRTILSANEVKNAEELSRIYVKQYDDRVKLAEQAVNKMSKAEKGYLYAETYGYKYEETSNKIFDLEGNEVKVDKKIIEDVATEQTVLLGYTNDVDSLNAALSVADEKFVELSGKKTGAEDFISGILSGNTELDSKLLKEYLAENSTVLQDTVDTLTEGQIAAILGISADKVDDSTIDQYKQELSSLVEERGQEIIDTQEESIGALYGMLAKTSGVSIDKKILDSEDKETIEEIKTKVAELNQEQQHRISAIGQTLQAVGTDTMGTFLEKTIDFYTKNTDEASAAVREFDKIIEGTNWESPISRLNAYNKAIKSSTKDIREWGKDLKATQGEANLLGEAFTEFISSNDWTELQENAEKFKNTVGEFDTSGIIAAAEESYSLNALLETGEINAGGLAIALQGIEEGKYGPEAVNTSVLKLLSSLKELETASARAHNFIKDFDPGIDTGEGEDFLMENAKKVKEFIENEEYGNEQLHNYIKAAVGTENWEKALRDNRGNIKGTVKELSSYITDFESGFNDVYDQLAQGLTKSEQKKLKTLTPEKQETLKDIGFSWSDEYLNIDIGKATTQDLQDYFVELKGYSKEYADLFLQDILNYNDGIARELQANDLMSILGTQEFKETHLDAAGNVIMTDAEIRAFADATGQSTKEALADLSEQSDGKISLDEESLFKVLDENGQHREDYQTLSQEYAKTFFGVDIKELTKQTPFVDEDGRRDLGKIVSEASAKMDREQSLRTAWEAYQASDKQGEFLYEGKLLDKSELGSFEEFVSATEALVETSQWVEIGKAIAQGMEAYEDAKTRPAEIITETAETTITNETKTSFEQQLKEISSIIGTTTTEIEQIPITTKPEVKLETTPKIIEPIQKEGNLLVDTAGAVLSLSQVDEAADHTIKKIDEGADFKVRTEDTAKKLAGVARQMQSAFSKNTINVSSEKVDTSGVKSFVGYAQKQKVQVPVGIKDQATTQFNRIRRNFNLKTVRIPVQADLTGSRTITLKTVAAATGLNNYIPHTPAPSFGSAAKGRYGTIGPKDKGGLTLTGEKGFEIAWIPSENRSMVLGLKGPQLINLPAETVVYTHEQSKKIVKQKPKSSGSSANTSRKKTTGTGSGGTSKSKKTSKKSKTPKKPKNPNNFSIEQVVRFDIDQRLAVLMDKINSRTKEIEKLLDRIGTKATNITKQTKEQAKALNAVQNRNDALVKSYNKDLQKLDEGPYYEKISYNTGGKNNKEKVINLASYIYKSSDDSYQINKDKIAKLSKKAEREAVFKAAESALNPLVSGLQKARSESQKAKEQLEELGKKVSETFYQWKNEITEVYDLTQRVSNEESLRGRFSSQVALELSKLKSGFEDTAESIGYLRRLRERDNKVLLEQVENQQIMIAARQRELQAAFSYVDEQNELARLISHSYDIDATKTATIEWAEDELKAAQLGQSYLKNIRQDIDGSLQYEIDWEKFNLDQEADPFNKKTYEAIKKYLDELNSASTDFNNSIKTQTDLIQATYETLREYQDYIADFEDTLLQGVEEQIQNDIDNTKDLSNSITQALKDLLDEVKRKLDERRRQEDNLKTESDISKKQQQLAMLRADTSGGNAVKIAQLEKEIADTQQSYERTLEDQLIDRLRQQGDEAAQQRERQIEIAESQLDVSSDTNKELVNLWLNNPEAYKEEIKQAWLETQNYEEKGTAGQYILESEFESNFANLVYAIEQSAFKTGFQDLSGELSTTAGLLNVLNSGVDELTDILSKAVGALQDATIRNTESLHLGDKTAQNIKDSGLDVASIKDWENYNSVAKLRDVGFTDVEIKGGGYGVSDFQDAGTINLTDLFDIGFTGKELKASGYQLSDFQEVGIVSAKALLDSGFTGQELKDNGYSLSSLQPHFSPIELKELGFQPIDFYEGNISYAQAKNAGFTDLNVLKEAGYTEAQAELDKQNKIKNYLQKITAVAKDKKLTTNEFKSVVSAARNAGFSARTYMAALAKAPQLSWKDVIRAAKNSGYSKTRIAKTWSSKSFIAGYNAVYGKDAYKKVLKTKGYKNAKAYSYKQGGLADYTGPAWLDGTPAKPELILNAQDTKNFIALKDILSGAINSTKTVSNDYQGDLNYEININVDHINSDYDVDSIAKKIEQKITDSAKYRNVNVVRNFR